MSKAELQRKIGKVLEHHPLRDHVRKISLFGSYLRGEETEKSDVDLLVEFQPPVGFFELASIEIDLEKALKKHVDLVTPNSLSKYFRSDVIASAEVMYER